jgi:hypothetical protein
VVVYAHQGNVAANIRDNTSSSIFSYAGGIDVSSYSQIKVEFWFYAVSMDPGEDFFVEFYSGSAWQTIATYVSGTHFSNGAFYQVGGADLVITRSHNSRTMRDCDSGAMPAMTMTTSY